MYQIAMLPIREEETRTLIARNDVWEAFKNELRRQRQGAIFSSIVIDSSQEYTKITLPTERAHDVLRVAGLRY